MIIRIWGVRGSSPTPLTPEGVRRKIERALSMAEPSDLNSEKSRKQFLAGLPADISSTIGGNTACIEVRTSEGKMIILDTGTGLRELENHSLNNQSQINEYHIFLSHFHYDHLMGIPFFSPMYNEEAHIHFYSPFSSMEKKLRRFMSTPYHPVNWDSFTADIDFHKLENDETVHIGSADITWIHREHPGGGASYKVSEKNRSIIYSSDTQLTEKDFRKSEKNINYFKNADIIIHDAQFTLEEAIAKYDWGHSTYSLAVQFAREFNIKKLLLFHHDPLKSDSKLEEILAAARQLDAHLKGHHKAKMVVELAREGIEIQL